MSAGIRTVTRCPNCGAPTEEVCSYCGYGKGHMWNGGCPAPAPGAPRPVPWLNTTGLICERCGCTFTGPHKADQEPPRFCDRQRCRPQPLPMPRPSAGTPVDE